MAIRTRRVRPIVSKKALKYCHQKFLASLMFELIPKLETNESVPFVAKSAAAANVTDKSPPRLMVKTFSIVSNAIS